MTVPIKWLYFLGFGPITTGLVLTIWKTDLGIDRRSVAFNSLADVVSTSLQNMPYQAAIFIGALLWAVAVRALWHGVNGSLKADSLIGRTAPGLPGVLIPLAISCVFLPVIYVNAFTTLAVNIISFLIRGSFFAFPAEVSHYSDIFWSSVAASGIFLIVIPAFARTAEADMRAIYFAGSQSLRVSISQSGRHWRIHFKPDPDHGWRAKDFFTLEMGNFAVELERLGKRRPEVIEADSTLLAEKDYIEKQNRLFDQLAEQFGYRISSQTRHLTPFQVTIRKLTYPQLKTG